MPSPVVVFFSLVFCSTLLLRSLSFPVKCLVDLSFTDRSDTDSTDLLHLQ